MSFNNIYLNKTTTTTTKKTKKQTKQNFFFFKIINSEIVFQIVTGHE